MISSAAELPMAELQSMARASDVCILGAGPAGLGLALEMSSLGAQVLVLDSGPKGGSRQAEKLSIGDHRGFLDVPVHELRKRGLGGTSRAWASNLARLTPSDFEHHIGIPDSGWPISFETVNTWIDPALRRLGCDLTVAELQAAECAWRKLPLASNPGLEPRAIAATATGDVGTYWRDEIEHAPRIHVVTDAHVSRLATSPDGRRVTEVECVDATRNTPQPMSLRPERVIVATGGIEAPRLLLSSADRPHPEGIGNHAGHLGRWYQDHPFAWCGSIEADEPGGLDHLLFPAGQGRGPKALGALLCLSETELATSSGTDAGVFVLGNRPWMAGQDFNGPAMTSLRRTQRAVRAGHLPVSMIAQTRAMAVGAPSLVRLARQRRTKSPDAHAVRLQACATPQWESRISLSPETDRFGRPRPIVDWRVGTAERRGAQRVLEVLGAAAASSGVGSFRPGPVREDGWPATIETGYHPSGTTRMSRAPEDGVVDTDLQVHGIDNLWINSSSVFPTIGYANPTLTVVALGIRLAHHLNDG